MLTANNIELTIREFTLLWLYKVLLLKVDAGEKVAEAALKQVNHTHGKEINAILEKL